MKLCMPMHKAPDHCIKDLTIFGIFIFESIFKNYVVPLKISDFTVRMYKSQSKM